MATHSGGHLWNDLKATFRTLSRTCSRTCTPASNTVAQRPAPPSARQRRLECSPVVEQSLAALRLQRRRWCPPPGSAPAHSTRGRFIIILGLGGRSLRSAWSDLTNRGRAERPYLDGHAGPSGHHDVQSRSERRTCRRCGSCFTCAALASPSTQRSGLCLATATAWMEGVVGVARRQRGELSPTEYREQLETLHEPL